MSSPGLDRFITAWGTGGEVASLPGGAATALPAGAVSVGLGPRILRCETAPLAALAAVLTLTGDLE